MIDHRVVIVGGGFGGLAAARGLKRVPVDVTLIDRRNFHVFQPLLYQVATGGLSPANVASTHRWILRNQQHTRVWLGEVTGLDLPGKRVILADGEVPYDTLILAAGAEPSYFGNDAWSIHAPGLKTIEDATEIRRRIYRAFEAAEREPDPQIRDEWMTFVLVGAGPTGVELAGAMAEIARRTLREEFRSIDPGRARIILLDAAKRVLPTFPQKLSDKCLKSLDRLGVSVQLGAMVTEVTDQQVRVKEGEDERSIRTRTVLWAAGVKATSLGTTLAEETDVELDRQGRVMVEPDLSVTGNPEVFVIGDLANFSHDGERPLPGMAPVAQQQGRYVARLIKKRLRGESVDRFRYRDKGQLATIGRAAAVADFGRLRFAGLPAWLLWLFVHLMYLVDFENRVLVFFQWAWNYLTWHRGARLIAHRTEPNKLTSDAAD